MDHQLDITDAGPATVEQEMEQAGGSATADGKPAEANLGEGLPCQAHGTAENREARLKSEGQQVPDEGVDQQLGMDHQLDITDAGPATENRKEEKSIDEEIDRADDRRMVPEKRKEGETKTEVGAEDMQESKGPELHEQAAGERQLKEPARGVSSKALLTSSAVRWSLQGYPSWAVTGAQAHVLKYPVRAARLCAGLSAVLVG